jgi:hypothetical protein
MMMLAMGSLGRLEAQEHSLIAPHTSGQVSTNFLVRCDAFGQSVTVDQAKAKSLPRLSLFAACLRGVEISSTNFAS